MQTSPIINPANLASSPAPARQAEKNGGESSFGQTLSREIAERATAAEPPKPVKENKPSAETKPARDKATASANAVAPAKKEIADKAQAADAADAGSDLKEVKIATDLKEIKDLKDLKNIKDLKKQQAEDAEAATAAGASENMLALVAGAGQINAAAGSDKTAAREASALPADGNPPEMTAAALQAAQAAAAAGGNPSAEAAKPPSNRSPQPDAALAGSASIHPDVLTDAAIQADGKPIADGRKAAESGATAFNQELSAAAPLAAPTDATQTDVATKLQDALPGLNGAAPATLQQQALQGVQAAGPQADKLMPRVGTPAWDQALGQKVVWMVAGEQQSASLTLNPPDLGPLQVVLNVSNSQANATFISAQPEVRQALEAAMPKLREMLGEAGIQLGQSSVNAGTPNQQGGFGDQQAPSSRHDGRTVAAGDASLPATARVLPSAVKQGLVDTFA